MQIDQCKEMCGWVGLGWVGLGLGHRMNDEVLMLEMAMGEGSMMRIIAIIIIKVE